MGALAGSLHRTVTLLDRADAVDGWVQNWAWSLHGKLCGPGYHLPLESQHMPRIVVRQVLAMQATRKQQCWEGLEFCPRSHGSVRAHYCKLQWFALPADAARIACLRLRPIW